MSLPFTYRLKTVLDFGKHKGETVQWAIDNDLGWVKWAHRSYVEKNTPYFPLHADALQCLIDTSNGQKQGFASKPHSSIYKRHKR